MLYKYLTYAFYTLRRHPSYAGLNVLGLSLALGCCLLLYWYISFHLSFDRYHHKADRTVRLVTEIHQGGVEYSKGIPTPVGPALRRDIPWLEQVAMSIRQDNQLIRVMDTNGRPGAKFLEENLMAYVEPQYFKIMDYQWQSGSPDSSLRQPYTAVLTRRLARKYFGDVNPIGRCLRMNNRLDLTVTGLVNDIPDNTDQPFELFVSYETLKYFGHFGTGLDQWDGVNTGTFCWVVLPSSANVDRLRRELRSFHRKNHALTVDTYYYQVLPLIEQHFSETYGAVISYETLLVLTCIGALLLLTACVNFINMATAQAFRRGREIGVRRVIGATRRRVFWQFIVETAVLTSISAGLGIVLAYTALPFLREWTDTRVPFGMDVWGWAFLLSLAAVVTFLAGTYPGLILAGFRPALVLKGQANNQTVGGVSLRRWLVVGQLTLSQAFVVAVVVMAQQLALWLRADPGFNPTHRVSIPVQGPTQVDLARFRYELKQIPGVDKVSFSFSPPAGGTINTFYIRYDNRTRNEPFQIMTLPVDSCYLSLFDIQLVAGRNLSDSDTVRGFVINETAVQLLGLKSAKEVLGRTLTIPYSQPISGPILGVVRDWRHNGFKNGIHPIALFTNRRSYESCNIKLTPNAESTALQRIQAVWNRYFPDALYKVSRLDEQMVDFYEYEKEQLRIIQLAAGVAILIGCVGLYGLITFLTNGRTREIAVRKALGAHEGQIVWLFITEFLRLLALAFVLALPVAWWLMRQWLSRYETRIDLTPDVFMTGLVVVAVVTLLTIGYQTLRAALANPARALRAE